MSQFDTTGSGHLPVGPVRIHLDGDGCNHRYGNVCPACAELTDEEVWAIREHFALLMSKRDLCVCGHIRDEHGDGVVHSQCCVGGWGTPECPCEAFELKVGAS